MQSTSYEVTFVKCLLSCTRTCSKAWAWVVGTTGGYLPKAPTYLVDPKVLIGLTKYCAKPCLLAFVFITGEYVCNLYSMHGELPLKYTVTLPLHFQTMIYLSCSIFMTFLVDSYAFARAIYLLGFLGNSTYRIVR